MTVLWLKALHIIFMVTWFAGLFYLPRLFVYHAMTEDEPTRAQFRIMERKLYYGIMNPGAVLTVLSGIWLWVGYGIGDQSLWLQLKIGLVLVLIGYHFWCGRLVKRFQKETNVHGHIFYRWFNEFPVLILVGAVLLVVLKPN